MKDDHKMKVGFCAGKFLLVETIRSRKTVSLRFVILRAIKYLVFAGCMFLASGAIAETSSRTDNLLEQYKQLIAEQRKEFEKQRKIITEQGKELERLKKRLDSLSNQPSSLSNEKNQQKDQAAAVNNTDQPVTLPNQPPAKPGDQSPILPDKPNQPRSQDIAANNKGEPATSPIKLPSGPVGEAPPQSTEPQRPPEMPRLSDAVGGVLTPKGKFVVEPSLEYAFIDNNRVFLDAFTFLPAIAVGLIDLRQFDRHTLIGALGGGVLV